MADPGGGDVLELCAKVSDGGGKGGVSWECAITKPRRNGDATGLWIPHCAPLCGSTNTKTGRAEELLRPVARSIRPVRRSQAHGAGNDRPHRGPISFAGRARRDPKRLALSEHGDTERAIDQIHSILMIPRPRVVTVLNETTIDLEKLIDSKFFVPTRIKSDIPRGDCSY
jgi:hypothetical protein